MRFEAFQIFIFFFTKNDLIEAIWDLIAQFDYESSNFFNSQKYD